MAMEHRMSAITSHCAGYDKTTIHWIWAMCTCGQSFAESSTSLDYRAAATALSRKAVKHVAEANQYEALAQPAYGEEDNPTTMLRPPRVSDA